MKKTALVLCLATLVIIGFFIWMRSGKKVDAPQTTQSSQPTQTTESDKSVYTDPSGSISLTYPSFAEVHQVPAPGATLAEIVIPKSFEPGTNFSEARFTVTRSAGMQGCVEGKKTSKEAAAGNLYETTTYSKVYDGDCYNIEYIIHSTNIGNYPVELGIKEFDRERVMNALEGMVKSLKFLISSN